MSATIDTIWTPENGGMASDRVLYPGFRQSSTSSIQLVPGRTLWQPLNRGDLLRLSVQSGTSGNLWLAAIDQQNNSCLSLLGLPQSDANANNGSLNSAQVPLAASFASEEIVARLKLRGLALENLEFACLSTLQLDDPLHLRAEQSITVIAINDDRAENIVAAIDTTSVTVEINFAPGNDWALPEPIAEVREEFAVHRGTARAYEISAGEIVQIIDVEGRQCSDFMAMNSEALSAGRERYIDSAVSRTMTRAAYPIPGLFDKFFDQDMKPLLAVVQDTVGRHDTFALACTARGYEERGFPGHLNCSDNISDAYEAWSIERRRAWPAINFFFNSWIHPSDNRMQVDEAWSRAGDYVAMRALRNLVCVSTACPDDVDPINGWNPTDIHVRIYRSNNEIPRAVGYRATAQSEAIMTRESAFHERTGKLTSQFSVARDVWSADQYDATGAIEEYWTCRNAATIQDMSSLRKLDIAGPDAERLLQQVLSRDIARLSVSRGVYALMLDEQGSVIDDGTLFRMAPDVFRWCCGSDDSALQLKKAAQKLSLRVWVRDMSWSLANVAVQGPLSRDILSTLLFTQPTQPSFDNIKWFGFCIARVKDRDGVPLMVTRTGYTGELGYELFFDQRDAVHVWDAVVAAGAEKGLKPMGSMALEMLRVEAGLMAAGAEFGPDCDADESGLGFAVDLKKTDFNGRAAIVRNRNAERRCLVGLLLDGEELPIHGDQVFIDRRAVGVITSAAKSPQLGKVLAMCRLSIEARDRVTNDGTVLEVGKLDGHRKRLPCQLTQVPFIDPDRNKPRS